tara:strand:- start:3420 stop:5054 length:1635 start_codon:yes stop_codon:yes gene_type:complete
MTKTTLIVLGAGPSINSYPYGNQIKSPSNLHIGTKLAIEEISKVYNYKFVDKKILAVENSNQITYKLKPFNEYEIVSVGKTKNVLETLLKIADSVHTDWCVINPITTIPVSTPKLRGSIYFSDRKFYREDWASIGTLENNKIVFKDRHYKDSLDKLEFAFTGKIEGNTKEIRLGLEHLIRNKNDDLIDLAEYLYQQKSAEIEYEKWLDLGHRSTFQNCRYEIISSRYFNNLKYNHKNSTIEKSSLNKKPYLEGEFIENLPIKLKKYFPTLIEKGITSSQSYLIMEYINYPNLAETYLYADIGKNNWNIIMNKINNVLDDFYGYKEIYRGKMEGLYSQKLIDRKKTLEKILQAKGYKTLRELYQSKMIVNGIEIETISQSTNNCIKELGRIDKFRYGHIGHGDLCFNNILCEPISGTLKLIDPKAYETSDTSIIGLNDKLYDIAKLYHSISYLYDSIVNNLYSFRMHDNKKIDLKIYKPKEYLLVNKLWNDIIKNHKIDKNELRIVTASLFYSMLPLHKEDEERMLVLSIVGSFILYDHSMKYLI